MVILLKSDEPLPVSRYLPYLVLSFSPILNPKRGQGDDRTSHYVNFRTFQVISRDEKDANELAEAESLESELEAVSPPCPTSPPPPIIDWSADLQPLTLQVS